MYLSWIYGVVHYSKTQQRKIVSIMYNNTCMHLIFSLRVSYVSYITLIYLLCKAFQLLHICILYLLLAVCFGVVILMYTFLLERYQLRQVGYVVGVYWKKKVNDTLYLSWVDV